MKVSGTILAAVSVGFASLATAAIPVSVERLSEQLVELEVRAPALVVPANQAVLTAQISALIKSVHADVGAAVRSGDLLIRLDDADARLALDQTQADLRALDAQIEQARARLTRGEELFKRKFIADDDLLERRTTLSVLVANRAAQELAVRSARLMLVRTQIAAPFDATIVARQAQVGSLAMPGSALLTLVQTDHREIDADLDPRFASRLAAATGLRFVSQELEWPVDLQRMSSVIDAASRIQKARFRFSAEAAPIGTSGEVVWKDTSGLLPVSLVVQRGDALGVFVADDSRARFVVLPGAQEGRPARTTLPPETLLVVRGQSRLQDGDELQITHQ
jgi:RND family efflux transporter MFP subunit